MNLMRVSRYSVWWIAWSEERGKLFDEVEAEWLKKKNKALERQQTPINDNDEDDEDDSSDEIEECIVKVWCKKYLQFLMLLVLLIVWYKVFVSVLLFNDIFMILIGEKGKEHAFERFLPNRS